MSGLPTTDSNEMRAKSGSYGKRIGNLRWQL